MTDLWEDAVDEAFEAEGIKASPEQIRAVAGWMRSASDGHSEMSGPPVEPPRAAPPEPTPEPKHAWWEDRSQLSGKDWVLSGQIHALINSR